MPSACSSFHVRACRSSHYLLPSHLVCCPSWPVSAYSTRLPLTRVHGLHLMPRTWRCQICKSHRSQWPRTCQVCKRWVLPGCNPEWCLAQDEGSEDKPRPAICKECFVSVRQAIAPLTRTMPRALEVVRDRNWVLHKFGKQPDVMLLSHSF